MKPNLRTILLAFGASLSFAPAAFAADAPETSPVTALDTALISTMKSAKSGQGFQARYQALAPVVEKAYDFPAVTQNSVGFLWSTLPADQQQQLVSLFEQFTISSYVAQFNDYGGQSFTLLPNEKALGQKKIVETMLNNPGGDPVEIDYVMADGSDGWQINDVLLGGTISQVAVHASDFASLVKSGDASALISALKGKISALQDGSGQ